ncbi:MAG: PEP-CTERM sorting domain-containing protein [Peristeroidobacter soli]
MKVARATLVSVLLSAACMQVHAVPIVFDFTGTVTGRSTQVVGGPSVNDDSLNGVAYSASLTIESDLLLRKPVQDFGDQLIQEFTEPEFGTAAVTGSLVIGGETIDLRPYSRNIGNVSFGDQLDFVTQTYDGLIDSVAINANSRAPEPTFPAESGLRGSGRVLSLIAYELWNPTAPATGMGSFDNLSLDDLLSMPLPNATLSYLDAYWTCEVTYCIQLPATRTTFSIDTLTRRVASVPEPATLGLFALGLIGAAGVRRRLSMRP